MEQLLLTAGPVPKAAWKYGEVLVVENGACIPDRCIKCNGATGGYRALHRVFSYRPHSLRSLVLFPVTLLISFLSERASGEMPLIEAPLCDKHRAQRDRPRLYAAIALVIGLIAIAAAIAISNPRYWVESLIAGLIGFYAIGASMWLMLITRQVVGVYPNPGSTVWLNGVCDEYLATLERWPGAPRY
jgi:hypothetical protein